MCLGSFFVNGPIFAKIVVALLGIGMIAGSSFSAMEYIEIDREEQTRQEPPRKEPVARPEVTSTKRDKYEAIKVAGI
jgi:hypothetical protein